MDQYNALHIRQSPNLRKAIADTLVNDTVLFGCSVCIPSSEVCKIIAATNVDWACLDVGHTPCSPTLMADMIQTLRMYSQGRILPIVRIPAHALEWVSWALDAGAGGVIVPRTETPEQARASIAAARFPPTGHRSFPPFALLPGAQQAAPEGKTWMNVASDHCAIILQIETGLGVENLEEILQVEGIDAFVVSPMDLAMDLGHDAKRVAEAMGRIEALGRRYRKPLVAFAPESAVVDKYKAGYRLICTVFDLWLLKNGIDAGYQKGKDIVENYQKEQKEALVK